MHPHSSKLKLKVLPNYCNILIILTFFHVLPFAQIVGYCVNVNLFFFYGAPLISIVKVLKERNSAPIHLGTMITNTLNSTFWTAYGFAILDGFIFIPNGIGAMLGFVQIVLVALLPRKISNQGKALDSKVQTTNESLSDKHKPTVSTKEVTTLLSNV
jgi:uncharacterized protein with PQ loop repeat